MAMLQVAINPLLRVAGGEEHFAFNSVLAQLIFGAGLVPQPVHLFLLRPEHRPSPAAEAQAARRPDAEARAAPTCPGSRSTGSSPSSRLVMVVVLAARPLPGRRPEGRRAGRRLGDPQGAVQEPDRRPLLPRHLLLRRHGAGRRQLDLPVPQDLSRLRSRRRSGATAVALVLGADDGRLRRSGLVLLKFFDSRKVLIGFTAAALVFLTVALFGPGPLALLMFPLMGFCRLGHVADHLLAGPELGRRATTAPSRASCARASSAGPSCRSSSAGWATCSACGRGCSSST